MIRFNATSLLTPASAIGAAVVLAAGLSAAPAFAQSSTTITTEQPMESQTKTKVEDDGVERTTKSKTENPDGSVTRSKTTEPSGGSSSTTVEEPPSTTVVVPR